MIYIKLLIIILFVQLMLSFDCFANTNNKNDIVDFVQSFVESNIELPTEGKLEVSVPPIDPRLNIKPCLSKLNANIPENHNGRNVNVKIVCNDPTPWQLYIPVKVKSTIPVLVATTVLVKGSVITESNTDIEYRNVHSMRGESVNSVGSVAGGRLKRRLSKGGIVSPRNICLVCKGETVTIIATSDDFCFF